jgi:ferritin-like metal-binding protein YciE
MSTALAEPRIKEKLIDYLQDAHAMEQTVLRMLDALIATTTDEEVRARLRQHRTETERHRRIVEERLRALGSGPSLATDAPAVFAAWLKSQVDRVRPDYQGKVGRDAYITEHVEIAAYSLLERLAERAGDEDTARAARDIRGEEEAMARWIADRWGRFVDLTLAEASIDGRSTAWQPARAWSAGGMTAGPVGTLVGAAAVVAGGYMLYEMLAGARECAERRPSVR